MSDARLDIFWLFINGVLVFFMQCGFSMLEAGTVQLKNVKNIMLKNMADVCACGVGFYLIGFGVAYGDFDNDFIGTKNYFGGDCFPDKYSLEPSDCNLGYIEWFFQFAFAATSATIVSGSVAERTQFTCYVVYSTLITTFVYPVVAHWVWGGGWLGKEDVHDFAGCGVVHLLGGAAGLVGAFVVGPRYGRFEGPRFQVQPHKFKSNSIVYTGLGVFILWVGWYGFNTGSVSLTSGREQIIELVVINTTISPAVSGLVCLIWTGIRSYHQKGRVLFAPEVMMNGVLIGLVATTAGADVLSPGWMFLVGVISGLLYMSSSWLMVQLKIDDPLDAVPIHFFGGWWGLIATGLFADKNYSRSAGLSDYGAFLGGSGSLLGWNLVEGVVVTVWTSAWLTLAFVPLRILKLARVKPDTEKLGLDHVVHGGTGRHTSVALDVLKSINIPRTGTNIAVPMTMMTVGEQGVDPATIGVDAGTGYPGVGNPGGNGGGVMPAGGIMAMGGLANNNNN